MPLSSCPLLTLKDGDAERGRWEDSKRAQVPASGLPVRSPNTQVGVGGILFYIRQKAGVLSRMGLLMKSGW